MVTKCCRGGQLNVKFLLMVEVESANYDVIEWLLKFYQ